MPDTSLRRTGPFAVITGASSGIGYELARCCARRGYDAQKAAPAEGTRIAFDAMMRGEDEVVRGWQNKLRAAIARVMPADVLAEQHRRMAEPQDALRNAPAAAPADKPPPP